MTSRDVDQQRCRTCLDTTDENFHSLDGKLVKDNQRKTLAGFLRDTCKLENNSEAAKSLPQQICGNCLRKLKITFSFVMQVEEVNRKMMDNLRTKNIIGQKSITIPEEYFEESNKMDVDNHSVCQPQECFIDCNNSLAQFQEDPIAISKDNNRKIMMDNSIPAKIGDDVENRKHSIFCKNDCHKEMKSMLQDLMNMQKQMNASFNDVRIYTERKISNQLGKSAQTITDIKRIATVRSWFPITTIEQALEVEDKIKNHGYGRDFTTYLKRNQDSTVDDVLRSIFKDELIYQYNLDGRSGKMSILSLDSILKYVQSAFSDLSEKKFFKLLRRYILLCHNRLSQKKYLLRKKQTFANAVKHHEIGLENVIYVCDESPDMKNTVEMEFDNETEQFSSGNFENSNSPRNVYNGSLDFKQCTNPKRTSISSEEMKTHRETYIDSNASEESYIVKLPKKSGSHQQQRIGNAEKGKISEICKLFPIQTQSQLIEIEENIMDTNYADEICEYFQRLKGNDGNVDNVLRKVFTDDLIADYNFAGLQGKHCLRDLHLISDCLFNAFCEITSMQFLKEVRKYVFKSHNRTKNNRRNAKRSLLPMS
nr:uncharacterized protein LOC106615964 isoform X2 [Bactrocera oleae]